MVRACPYSALVATIRLNDLQRSSASESVFKCAGTGARVISEALLECRRNQRSSGSGIRTHPALVVQRAIGMRSALTPSEAALWVHLRGGQLGVWFRRQVPLGRFIADFAAASAKLVVEVDGGYHARRVAADARRDRALARLGYRVVRVPAVVVIREPLVAVELVRAAIGR